MGYSFLDIIGLWWHGLKQTVLYYIPVIRPEREGSLAPTWFVRVFPSWLWGYYLDSDRRPTETWLYNYRYAANVLFKSWLDQLKAQAISGAITAVWGWTGGPKDGYASLSDWITAIRARVGYWVPVWTNNLAEGLSTLYLKIPYNIRHNITSWYQLFDDIKRSVKDWAIARYDLAAYNVGVLWEWVQYTGSVLKAFYEDVGTWVYDLKQNFKIGVISALGPVWWRLIIFDRDALEYYYNLWGTYRDVLSDFLSNPIGYIYDRVEDFILSKW